MSADNWFASKHRSEVVVFSAEDAEKPFTDFAQNYKAWIDCNTSDKARIVAAAPELLEALKQVLPFSLEFINDNHPSMKLARAAIAKAEGGAA